MSSVTQTTSTSESPLVRRVLIGVAFLLVFGLILLPLLVVFAEAFNLNVVIADVLATDLPWKEALSASWEEYWATVASDETWEAIYLTLVTAAWAVPLNTIFGVAAAWAVTKHNFCGKDLLVTLIDLPFSVSPVVAGMSLVLIFGAQGWFGEWLQRNDIQIIFALPGIVLATVFITFPFVARELIPLMQSQGTDEEQAARVLGATGWQTFFRVTLPNIKWGLLYGIILCNARAMGEFGAVYVVSGNFSGQITLPLHVERVYYASFVSVVPAFAVASLLGMLAVVTLVVKAIVEWKYKGELRGH